MALQLAASRLLLSLAKLLNFRLSSIDISGAYLQADPITRDIFVPTYGLDVPKRGLENSPSCIWTC
jgi:hypothetical protein